MADIDTPSLSEFTQSLACIMRLLDYPKEYIMYRTPHGFHVVCFVPLRFRDLYDMLRVIPYVDQSWRNIGYQRGYWFLWNRKPIYPPYPMTYMKLTVPEDCKWFTMKRQDT
jgi:hypothetical protein